MNLKKVLFVAALLAGAFIAGGYLAESRALEKNWNHAEQELKNFTVRTCVDYLYTNPNGRFNETAKKIYEDLTGHEFYRPIDIYADAERRLREMPLPTPKSPDPFKNPYGI